MHFFERGTKLETRQWEYNIRAQWRRHTQTMSADSLTHYHPCRCHRDHCNISTVRDSHDTPMAHESLCAIRMLRIHNKLKQFDCMESELGERRHGQTRHKLFQYLHICLSVGSSCSWWFWKWSVTHLHWALDMQNTQNISALVRASPRMLTWHNTLCSANGGEEMFAFVCIRRVGNKFKLIIGGRLFVHLMHEYFGWKCGFYK